MADSLFIDTLKASRKRKYGDRDIREFTAMMKEGAVDMLPPDLAPHLVAYRPQDDDELSLWLYVCLESQGLTCPFTRLPNHLQTDLKNTCSHLQFMADMFFERTTDCIVLGNRGSGKTVAFATLLLLESIHKPGYEMAHLGAIEDQAKRCYRYFRKITDHPLFANLLAGKPTSTRTEFANGSVVEILVGTMSGVNCLHGDMLIDCSRDYTKYPNGVPIRELVGQEFVVPSLNEETGEVTYRKAKGLYSGKSKCLEIKLARPKLGTQGKELEYTTLICTPEHPILMAETHKYRYAEKLRIGDRVQPTWAVVSVDWYLDGAEQDVYDISVYSEVTEGHNFPCNNCIVHNSPHPVISQIDEVELMDWNIMQEAFNMARSAKGYPSGTRLTSTRKRSSGTMQRLLDEADQRGFKVYQWNLWDTIETCPMKTDSRGHIIDDHEAYVYYDEEQKEHSCMVYHSCMDCAMVDACRGQAKTSNAGANAVVTLTDAIKSYKTLDPEVWNAQVICVKPGTGNLIYPMFKPELHVVDYQKILKEKYGPHYEENFDTGLDVYAGQDAGFGCPATVFLQVMDDPENGDQTVIIFDELYEHNVAPSKYVSEFLIPKHDVYNVQEWFCDPSNSQQLMAEMDLQGLYTVMGLKNVDEGLDACRALMSLGKLLVDKSCKNLLWELSRYEKMPNGKPRKVDDHLVDAMRFGVNGVGLYTQVLDEVWK